MTTRLDESKTMHYDVEALIQGIQLSDPRLYQILQTLNRGLVVVQEELFPLVQDAQAPPVVVPVLDAPAFFDHEFTPITVRLSWSEVPNAFGYEIREGASWDTATFRLRTNSLQADIDPLLVGTHTFLIKTINAAGIYSADPNGQNITVPPLGSITLESRVIDNNVLLRWDAPTSTFRILHYRAYRNGELRGTVDSTFFALFENVAGSYTYSIIAVDVAGNQSLPASVTVQVNTPPDYALQDRRVSNLMGTRVNVLRDVRLPSLLCCWSDQMWHEHFEVRSWDEIQDQIAAGYPIYIQPTVLTGSYEEVVDYGVVIQNTIITVTYNEFVHSPATVVLIRIATSEDGITYTPFVDGASLFSQSMRYLKVRLEFTNSDDDALLEIYNLTFSLSVKRENDGGEIDAYAGTEVGHEGDLLTGTRVNFTKLFKDIESITCTTKSTTEPFYVIFDFTDIPNPTHFFVFVFDSSGNRVGRKVDWKARGII